MRSGAIPKVLFARCKVCKSCRSRQELSNEYFLGKIGVDTAENEPSKFGGLPASVAKQQRWARLPRRGERGDGPAPERERAEEHVRPEGRRGRPGRRRRESSSAGRPSHARRRVHIDPTFFLTPTRVIERIFF